MLSLLFPTIVEINGLFGDVPHEGHLAGVEAAFLDERVMGPIGGTKPAAAAKAFIGRERAHWREHSFGMWFFRDLDTGSFAGWGGIRQVRHHQEDRAVELAYALVPQHRGRGSATEIGKIATQLGFENLGLTEVVSFVQPGNLKAAEVLGRCGFAPDGVIERAGLSHTLYRKNAAPRSA